VKRLLTSLVSLNPLSLALTTIVVVSAIAVWRVPILDLVELRAYDLRMRSRETRPPASSVVLAMIDERSLEAEGRWPWPRSKIAALVDLLSADGARVIAFDIGFLEPDEHSGLDLLDRVRRTVATLGIGTPRLDRFFIETRQEADNDRALAQAIRDSRAAVILGDFLHMDRSDLNYEVDQAEVDRRLELISSSQFPLVSYAPDAPEPAAVAAAYAPEPNLPILVEAAAGSGYFNVKLDVDGVVRWMPLAIRSGEGLFAPLSLVAAWHYLDLPALSVEIGAHGIVRIRMGERTIPTDESGSLLINYRGPPRTFPHVSISDILRGNVPAGTFQDRIVLVGASALGIYDARSTPLDAIYPGVEIQATVIDNILGGDFIVRPQWAPLWDVAAIVILTALVAVVLPRVGALAGLSFAAGSSVAYVGVAREAFLRLGVWLDVVYPLLAVVTIYTLLTLHHYVTEQRERKRVRDAFGRYVSPDVVERMLEDPTRLRLGGEQKVLTVLFSDLQGFTSNTERYGAQRMMEMLSEYYARMTERIFAAEGMLKEYIGDEIMAIFGAPLEHADHALRACTAALDMREHRRAMSEEWIASGRPPIVARTGINSGPMLVGNHGSEYRFTYGVLGDDVNLASRLEGLNKQYGTEILIGENTAALVDGAFRLREVDVVRVVGKQKPTRIFELLSLAGTALPEPQQKALRDYAAALEAYRARCWAEALDLLEAVLARWPDDGPARTMMRRCRTYADSPPPNDWDGAFDATSK
jgi:adenylate cyclase